MTKYKQRFEKWKAKFKDARRLQISKGNYQTYVIKSSKKLARVATKKRKQIQKQKQKTKTKQRSSPGYEILQFFST